MLLKLLRTLGLERPVPWPDTNNLALNVPIIQDDHLVAGDQALQEPPVLLEIFIDALKNSEVNAEAHASLRMQNTLKQYMQGSMDVHELSTTLLAEMGILRGSVSDDNLLGLLDLLEDELEAMANGAFDISP